HTQPLVTGRACRSDERARRPRAASHPDSHRRSRISTGSTGRWLRPGRGLSPPVRNFTDPGARSCTFPSCQTAATSPWRAHDVTQITAPPAVEATGARGGVLTAKALGGSGPEGSIGLDAQSLDDRRRAVGTVDGGSGDEDIGAGLRAALDGLRRDAAVDLEPDGQFGTPN